MPATEHPGQANDRLYNFTVAALDLANHTAVASVDTTVTVPTGVRLVSTDRIIARPPVAMEAGIAVVGCYYASATTFTLRTTNPSAGAINPAAADWTFDVIGK